MKPFTLTFAYTDHEKAKHYAPTFIDTEHFDIKIEPRLFTSWLVSHHKRTFSSLTEEEYGRFVLDFFNYTIRSHESPREFISIAIDTETKDVKTKQNHIWNKTNVVTIRGNYGCYDTVRCETCGVTGRRYGVSETITRDKEFKSKKYEYCFDKEK